MSARWYLTIGFLGLAADQIVKRLAMTSPPWSRGVFIIDDVFGLGARLNEQFAWGLPIGNDKVIVIAAIILAGLAIYCFRRGLWRLPLVFIFAGALSNLVDRIFSGGVIDYVLLPFGGAINLADILIFTGVFLLLADNKSAKPETNKPLNQ